MKFVVGLLALASGCVAQHDASVLPASLTWYRDALPLVQTHCQGCHKEGGIGPFALDSYDDAMAHIDDIAMQIENRTMPPWLPTHDGACSSLQGVRALPEADRATLLKWATAGAPAGDPADAPPPPAAQQGLTHVDMTLDAGYDYTPKTALKDDYHCSILDPGLSKDRILVGYDVTPGQRKEVHHVLLYPAALADAQAADAKEAGPGWTCFGDSGIKNASPAGGWAPGAGAVNYPPSTGVRIKKGQVIVMQVHYNLANGASPDRTALSLSFVDSVDNEGMMLPLLNDTFSIPPGGKPYSVDQTQQVPIGGTLWGVFPHMHTLGQQISVEMNGQCLINIPKWDFHWQQQYFFDAPQGIPFNPGDVAKLNCTWENTGTTAVQWGESTSDEMCLNFFFLSL